MDITKPQKFSEEGVMCEIVNESGKKCKNEAVFIYDNVNYCKNHFILASYIEKIKNDPEFKEES